MSAARERILARIRQQSGRSGATGEADLDLVRQRIAAHECGPLPTMAWSDEAQRFRGRCEILQTSVVDIAALADLPGEVARYLAVNSLPPRLVMWPEFASLDWVAAGIEAAARPAEDADLTGLTGCFCAVSETGTLMLLSGPATPKTPALLPETHIAVVRTSRIVRTMEDSLALLRAEVGEPPRAITYISGPSRTADIEQTIVIGAHGPYRVHAVLLAE